MPALVIKEHSRFAVCREANIRPIHCENAHADSTEALLVELSLDGCRLGNIPDGALSPGSTVSVAVHGAQPLAGTVRRWIDGALSVKFAKPLHTFELTDLISLCRGQPSGRTAIRA